MLTNRDHRAPERPRPMDAGEMHTLQRWVFHRFPFLSTASKGVSWLGGGIVGERPERWLEEAC